LAFSSLFVRHFLVSQLYVLIRDVIKVALTQPRRVEAIRICKIFVQSARQTGTSGRFSSLEYQ
jgi:hypothetical protein